MTEPLTEAGRRLLANWHGDAFGRADILAIEAEARADGDEFIWQKGYDKGRADERERAVNACAVMVIAARADALREAAERVRALAESRHVLGYPEGKRWVRKSAVLAILDPEAAPALDVEVLTDAMDEAYEYEPEYVPVLPFIDDREGFWRPFAAKVVARLAREGSE